MGNPRPDESSTSSAQSLPHPCFVRESLAHIASHSHLRRENWHLPPQLPPRADDIRPQRGQASIPAHSSRGGPCVDHEDGCRQDSSRGVFARRQKPARHLESSRRSSTSYSLSIIRLQHCAHVPFLGHLEEEQVRQLLHRVASLMPSTYSTHSPKPSPPERLWQDTSASRFWEAPGAEQSRMRAKGPSLLHVIRILCLVAREIRFMKKERWVSMTASAIMGLHVEVIEKLLAMLQKPVNGGKGGSLLHRMILNRHAHANCTQ